MVIAIILAACNVGKNEAAVPNSIQQTKNDSAIASNNNEHKSGSTTNTAYTITMKIYTAKKIKITYPQIAGLSDKDKESRINEILKNGALGICNYPHIDNQYAKGNYEIKWQSAKLLSVAYIGSQYYDGTPHPNNKFRTTNIDINNGSEMKLEDIITINNTFIEKVKQGKQSGGNLGEGYLAERFSNYELIHQFTNSRFYFMEDSLGVVITIPHVYGDQAEFEAKYHDIA